jgi:hypothetical protein
MAISTYLANALLNHQLGKAAYTMPTVYVALSSTLPGTDGTNVTEPTTGAYARVATSAATWNAATANSITNAAAITFPAATADWLAQANLPYAVMYDAATAGNMLSFATFTVAKNVLAGDTLSLPAGDVTVTLN